MPTTVSDVLRDRMREPDGFRQMAAISFAVHAAIGAFLLFGPGRWLSPVSESPRPIMTITFGGAGTGPQNGGISSIGARPVQTAEPAPKPEAVRPPAAPPPAMTLPKQAARQAPPPPKVEPASTQSRGRTPTRGDEVRAGTAVAETGARGQGFGLSTGGGAGGGTKLDVADFCCPEYVLLMREKILANWKEPSDAIGLVVVFTIQRDGRLTDVKLEHSSGVTALDLNAQRAVYVTRQLPPLPAAFPNPTLTVYLTFQYQR